MTWARCSVAWLMAWVSRIVLGTSRSTPSQAISPASPGCPWGERSEGVAPPGVPLEEMTFLPGTAVSKDGYLIPSDAPGFGIDVTLDWLRSRTVA